MADDYYFIANIVDGRVAYVITVRDQGTDDGTPIVIDAPLESSAAESQRWQLVGPAEGNEYYYFLLGEQSQKVIGVVQAGSDLTIQTQQSGGAEDQLWELVASGAAFYLRVKESQRVMDSENGGTAPGTPAVVDEEQPGSATQLWQLLTPMALTGEGFVPMSIDVEAGFVVDLGSTVGSTTIAITDENNAPYPLFGGDDSEYPISSEGTPYVVRDDAPEGSYTITADVELGPMVPVNGTINVKRTVRRRP